MNKDNIHDLNIEFLIENDDINFSSVEPNEILSVETLSVDYTYFHFELLPHKKSYSISAKDSSSPTQYIVIPREYQGLPVTCIESRGFKDCTNLIIVLFEENSNIKSIGYSAFENCKLLESIILPESVKCIEDYAFYHCSTLQQVYITSEYFIEPNDKIFRYTSPNLNVYLSKININLWDKVFYCSNSDIDILPLPDFIPADLGYFKFELNDDNSYTISAKNRSIIRANLILPSYYNRLPITIIGSDGFGSCSQIVSLRLPEQLITISDFGFFRCYRIRELEIPDSVELIGDNAFSNYTIRYAPPSITPPASLSELEAVRFGENSKLLSIGRYAFYGNIKVKEFNLPKSVVSIGDIALGCINVPSVYIGPNVKTIGFNPFTMSTEIKEFKVDQKNTIISTINGALFNYLVRSLLAYPMAKDEDIYTFESNLRIILETLPLYQCKNLRVLYINAPMAPRLLTDYPYFNSNLNSFKIYVPDSVLQEYKNSIQWSNYTNIIYSQNIIKNGLSRIDNTLIQWIDSKENITIPKDIQIIGPFALGQDKNIKNIYVEEGHTSFSSQNGILFNFDKSELIRYPQIKEDDNYTVPSSVKKIGLGAFIGGENLYSVKLDENIEEIGGWAFSQCFNLENINLENVKKIRTWAFYYCNLKGRLNLNSLEILEDSAIRRELFYKTSNEQIYGANLMDVTEIVFGENIKSIGRSTLPNDVTLYIKAKNPPAILYQYYVLSKIYVPSESLELYKNHPNWKYYSSIIYPMDF